MKKTEIIELKQSDIWHMCVGENKLLLGREGGVSCICV